MQHNSSPESRYRFIFESANVGLWEEDYSQVKRALDELQRQGVRDLRAHLLAHPEQVRELMGLVRILDVNEETLKMHGARSKDELLGSLARIAVPEAGPVFLEALVAIAEGHNHFEAEVPGKTLQGERIDTIIRLTVPRDTEGFRNLIVSTVDISARKAMERALRESEERYRAIFEGAKVSLWEEDVSGLKAALDGLTAQGVGAIRPYLDAHPEFVASCLERIRILGVNRETLRLYEAESESELLGSLSGVFTPESVEGFKGLLVAVAEGRSFIEEEIKARTLRGRPIDTLLSAAMPDTEEGFKHLIVSIVDLTEHRRLEREMQKAQKLESLGVLAGGIAHDFNNILTAILGNVSLLAAAGLAAPEARRMLEDLRKAVLRAQGLTQQLLTFSRGGEPVRRRLRLEGLIADTVAFALSGSNVVARFEIPEGLWAVDADEGQLAQVLHNLTLNAKQAMPGGGALTVRAANHRDRDGRRFLKIALQDQGVGIPERHLDRVFDPYFSTKQEGSGLGLAVVYSVVQRHGGFVEVASEAGQGSEFSVFLPVGEAPAIEEPQDPPEPSLPAGKGRVLFMDDEEMIRGVAGRMLHTLGCEVRCAADGAEAVAMYREHMDRGEGFAVVVMDLTVPGGMGGREALAELRALDPDVRAVVSSGYANDPILSRFRDYGFCGVLTKPFALQDLRRVLWQVLEPPGALSS